MIRVSICDDDMNFCLTLKNILQKKLKNVDVIDIFLSPFKLIDEIHKYDVLFLDYDLPYMNGISVLKEIQNYSILKIMITNFSHICFDTYQYDLFWFVRKHHFNYDINALIPHLNEELYNNKTSKLYISSSNKRLSVNFSDIVYVETKSNYLYIHTNKMVYNIRITFRAILPQFKNKLFIIPIYGVIINLNFIEFIDFKKLFIQMRDGRKFPISRNQKRGVMETYGKYISFY
ncbi:chemotaxis response regulator protein-glutamate methylesterase [Thomasclavelia cocleata]|uniref:Chemotaxis response regulator protein-glutamate methylesterase n=1 Tax=Thomasclavelia cocleata TaxID=69824 RepID=A0A829ZHG4_9FIRM|nr:LytTR family transcriptional regulator DNA-binding domain-containing protein [Thomasclavelia cocleata]GFI42334.1 chemotaxis response regulator protein-glutamate methylesterase [Thomasclavelia cocleata]